jgi:hypothetical protein
MMTKFCRGRHVSLIPVFAVILVLAVPRAFNAAPAPALCCGPITSSGKRLAATLVA